MAALHSCPWQEEPAGSAAKSTGKRREQTRAVSWLAGPLHLVCASSTRWEKAADCAHSIFCLRKTPQQRNSLLNCMKIKPWIDLKGFDARSVSHSSFYSLAVKWHQRSAQTLQLYVCHHAQNTILRQCSLCDTKTIPKVWRVSICPEHLPRFHSAIEERKNRITS